MFSVYVLVSRTVRHRPPYGTLIALQAHRRAPDCRCDERMTQKKTILCPTDLSPEADGAIGYSASLAASTNAKLLVVYWPGGESPAPVLVDGIRPGPRGLFEESIALNVGPGAVGQLDWEGLVVDGPTAAEAIVAAAAERRADLVVMRSRRRPLAAALLGSTAEAVCRTAPCSVLVTHPDGAGTTARRPDSSSFDRILVAYDFWDDSEIALQRAVAIAAEHGSTLFLLHAVPASDYDPSGRIWEARGEDTNRHIVERRLRSVAPRETPAGVDIVTHIVIGHPYREILSFAETNDVDLICMGARGRDFGSRSLFGSNTDRVLRQAPCPVLVARPLRPAVAVDSASMDTGRSSTEDG